MKLFKILLANLIFLSYANSGFSQAYDLGTATTFSVFTSVGAFSNDGATTITGNIGTNVGAFTGFPPGIVIGTINVANSLSATASTDLGIAYGNVAATACGMVIGTTLGSGQSLTPNVYCLGAASTLNGTLTLNGQGNPNALFVFKIDGALSTGTSANVVLTNGASICNVYWQVGGAFALGVSSNFRGNVLVDGAITLNINSSLNGRALSVSGAVELHTTNVQIPSPPLASISAGSSTSLCTGQSVTLTASAANSYLWTNGATTQSITVSTAGSYAVTVTNACGTATSAATEVTVSPSPTAVITAGGPLTFCQGSSVTMTASGGTSYLWSNGATSASISVTAGGSYTVIATNAGGCTAVSAATLVTVNSNPVATIVASGAITFCQGGSVVLMASAGASYLWNNGGVTQHNTVMTSGIHSVMVTSAGSCVSTSQAVTVTVLPNIIPTITANGPLSFCLGGSVILTSSVASGYLWSNGATTQSITVTASGNYSVTTTGECGGVSAVTAVSTTTTANPTITAEGPLWFCPGGSVTLTSSIAGGYLWSNGATTRSITVSAAGNYTVTTTGVCAGTSLAATVAVVAPVPPTITASGPLSFCQGGSVILTSSVADGYLWSNGATTRSITVTASGNFTVTSSGNCGATSASTPVVVMISVISTITAGGPLTFCPGGSVILTSSSASGYLWSNGATTQSITVTTAGSYTVSSTGSCIGTSTATVVQVNPASSPTISASGPLTFCPSGNVILTSSPASGYLWSTGATTQSITVTTAGNYSVTTSGGCAGTSAIVQVIINASFVPTISASGPLTMCPGEQVILTATAASGYLWSTGATTQSITVSVAGSYSVTTSGPCGGVSAATTVTVTSTIIPTITADGPVSFCVGGSVTLTASEAIGYLWSNGATTRSIIVVVSGQYTVTVAGSCAVVSAPVTVAISGTGAPTITSSGSSRLCTGDSTVLTSSLGIGYLWSTGDTTRSIIVKVSGSYTVITSSECGDTSSAFVITVTTAIPVVITASGATSFCIGGSVTLTASKGSSYFWSIGGKMQSIQVRHGGDYWVRVDNGCGVRTSPIFKVVVTPYPVCSIVATSPQCEVSSTRLCASTNAKYLWSTGDTSQCITISQVGTYSVTVTNASECSSTCSKTITASQAPDCTISGVNICPTQSSSVLSAPSGNVSYLWNTGATSQTITLKDSGVYTVTVTNLNGCVSTCSKRIALAPSVDCLIMGDLSICNGGTTELSAPMGFKSYLWSNGSTEAWVTVADSGVYTVIVTNSDGCVSKCTQRVTMEDCGVVCLPGYQKTVPNFQTILQQQKATDLRPKEFDAHLVPHMVVPRVVVPRIYTENFEAVAYPNPFTHSTTINFTAPINNDRWKVEVFNLQGQKVASLFEGLITANKRIQLRFDAADLIGGIYFYRITNGASTWSNRLVLSKD